MSNKDKALIAFMVMAWVTFAMLFGAHFKQEAQITAIETQLAHDANCIATLEVLQQAREQAEAGR